MKKNKLKVMTPKEFLKQYPPKKEVKPRMEDIFLDLHLACFIGISKGYWHNANELSQITGHNWATVKRYLRIMAKLGVLDEKIIPINDMQNKRGYRIKQRETRMREMIYRVDAEPDRFPYYFDNKEVAEKFSKKVKGSYVIEARVNNTVEEGLEEHEYYTDKKFGGMKVKEE